MKEFDKVTIVKPFVDADFPKGTTFWMDEMNETLGMEGVVEYIFMDGSVGVMIPEIQRRHDIIGFAYHPKSLRVKGEAPLCRPFEDINMEE